MRATNPHFLLFSSADVSASQASRWQFVLRSLDGHRRFAAGDEEPDAPCERAELLAVVRGLEALDQPSRVTLVTRSRYVSRGIVRCLDDWRAAQWRWERFGRLEPIRDHDLWQRVDRALAFHQVDCHTWPLPQAPEEMQPATPEEDGSPPDLPPDQGSDPAVLIVRKRPPLRHKEHVLRRLLSACDRLTARCGDCVAATLRCLLPGQIQLKLR